jgi:hypothetical protein
MHIDIHIEMDNAAFDEEEADGLELDRCLGRIAARYRDGYRAGEVRDTNGNTVGTWGVAP